MNIRDAIKKARELKKEMTSNDSFDSYCQDVMSMSLSAFKNSNMILTIQSRLLNDRIYFAGDHANINGLNGAIYSADELEELLQSRINNESLIRAHKLKKHFDGKIIKRF